MTDELPALTGLPRAEQIMQKLDQRTIPDPLIMSGMSQHAQAIATIELAKATRMLALLKLIEHPWILSESRVVHRADLSAVRDEVRRLAGLNREEPTA